MDDYSPSNPLVPPAAVAHWLAAAPQPTAVTGGTGFVGSHLVETLCAAGLRPRVLVRDAAAPRWIAGAPVEWVAGDLEDREALRRLVAGAGVVFHLAGVLRAASAADFDLGNRAGTAAVVSAVREHAPGARIVHVSSLAAAGPSPLPSGLGPECEPAPVSWYGRSKLAAERELRDGAGSVRWTILRPPAIYGPRDSDVFEFFRMAARGLVALPAGERWLTVAWVGDVVRAVVAASAAPPASISHLGDPEPVRLEELVRELAGAGGVRARIAHLPTAIVTAAGAVGSALQSLGWRRLPLTADKARELLARHWTARTADSLAALGLVETMPFREGAERTWSWYRARGWLG
jgi:nucleoside-diphosphate-sugar epimerase